MLVMTYLLIEGVPPGLPLWYEVLIRTLGRSFVPDMSEASHQVKAAATVALISNPRTAIVAYAGKRRKCAGLYRQGWRLPLASALDLFYSSV